MILFCFLTACLCVFIDFCFEKGNIFRKYYNCITYWLVVKRPKPHWIYKPLGGCVYCFGTWVFIVLFCVWSRENNFIISLFQGIGLNYVFIKAYQKYIE